MPRVKSTSRVSRRQSSPSFDYHSSSDDSLRSHTNATRRPAAIHPYDDDELAHIELRLQNLSIIHSQAKKHTDIHERRRDSLSYPVALTHSQKRSPAPTTHPNSRLIPSSPATSPSSSDPDSSLSTSFGDLSLNNEVARAGVLNRYLYASLSPPSPFSPFYPGWGLPEPSSPFVQIEDDQLAEDQSPWRLDPIRYEEDGLETRFGSLSLVTDIAL